MKTKNEKKKISVRCPTCNKEILISKEELKYAKHFNLLKYCDECDPSNQFNVEITVASEIMKDRLATKHKEKGDQWKKSTLEHLRERISFTYSMWLESIDTKLEDKKLIDLANQCVLFILRKKVKQNKKWDVE